MLSRKKYRRVPELYVTGTELALKDGTILWLQVLNGFEQDEARHDAMVARARMVMALKEHGSDELAKVQSVILVDGLDTVVERLVDEKRMEALVAASDSLANDPEWKERREITDRQDEILAREATDPERKLLDQINQDYLIEINRMVEEDLRGLREKYEAMTEDQILQEYERYYIERRGTDIAIAEHRLTEAWYAARCCEGVEVDDGEGKKRWDHSNCEGHTLQSWESKKEVRDLPEDLQELITTTLSSLTMSVREAKNSVRQGNSSGSSPLPSEVEESTPSTPVVIPNVLPGTSPSL